MYQPKMLLMLSSSLIIISLLILLMDLNWLFIVDLNQNISTNLSYTFPELSINKSNNKFKSSVAHTFRQGCNCPVCSNLSQIEEA